jgi:hypothetical protein
VKVVRDGTDATVKVPLKLALPTPEIVTSSPRRSLWSPRVVKVLTPPARTAPLPPMSTSKPPVG